MRVGRITGLFAALLGGLTALPAAAGLYTDPPPTGWIAAVGDVPALVSMPDPPSVYAQPEPGRVEEQANRGGVDLDFNFRYLTDYVYRGVSHNRAILNGGHSSASNYQGDLKVSFDFGPLPHPYLGVFGNVNDKDPLSRFQEFRPFVGFDYTLRPVLFDVGLNTYIYPERERFRPSPNTSEVYLRLTLDDSYLALTPKPILSPYVYAAYDYQRNHGWYLETGLKHEFDFPDFGVTVTPFADVAYVANFPQQFVTVAPHASGFQHWDVGLTAALSLNHAFHLEPRFGNVAVEGYLTYTARFSNPLTADTILWAGWDSNIGIKRIEGLSRNPKPQDPNPNQVPSSKAQNPNSRTLSDRVRHESAVVLHGFYLIAGRTKVKPRVNTRRLERQTARELSGMRITLGFGAWSLGFK